MYGALGQEAKSRSPTVLTRQGLFGLITLIFELRGPSAKGSNHGRQHFETVKASFGLIILIFVLRGPSVKGTNRGALHFGRQGLFWPYYTDFSVGGRQSRGQTAVPYILDASRPLRPYCTDFSVGGTASHGAKPVVSSLLQ